MTHRHYSSDKEEIRRLNKENEELRKKIASIPNFQFSITDRQKAIIEFITKNPGISKAEIIRKLTQDSKGSRVTIVNDIDELENEHHIIICKRDKPNSQIYKVYVNEDNILLDTYDKLYDFKKNFIETIDKVILDKNWTEEIEHNKFELVISSLILIYVHALNSYITYILLEWSNKFENDTILLNKLFSLIIFTFVEINLKLITSFQIPYVKPLTGLSTFREISSPLSQGFLYKQFLLKPHIILNILKEYQRINLHSQIFPLLESAWKLSYPIYENISIFGPSTNEIKLRPLKQIHYTDANLPLLLFHYVRDHCNKIDPKILSRLPESHLIPPSFDIPLKLDEVFYKTVLLETLGQEKYSKINREFLINELARFVEYLEGLNYKKEQITEWKKEYPNDKTFEIKCTKYIHAVENFISTILENKTIVNILDIFINIKECKTERPKKLKDSITLASLESFFTELSKYRDLEKAMKITYDDVMNAANINYENQS